MADLLTHVLVAYATFTVISWYVERLTPKWVAIGAIGSMVPDLNRIGMFVSEVWIESVLGVGFRFDALSTLGGAVFLCGIGATLFARERRYAFAVLAGGALTHLLIDAVKAWADWQAAAWLYPVTWWRHATPSLYVSADWWMAVGAVLVAGAVWFCDRRWFGNTDVATQ
ncbi:metal-dependent hydrolase [Natronoarchaeum rubrum]|uniref:metal-dependent hydrolase n=1 Tax=Natronoarchaeum rubrum TaxID=755311 RepID=UPI002111BAA9|nr:metal-dependent hydrolase [Natronoarchaeum rubrum]